MESNSNNRSIFVYEGDLQRRLIERTENKSKRKTGKLGSLRLDDHCLNPYLTLYFVDIITVFLLFKPSENKDKNMNLKVIFFIYEI